MQWEREYCRDWNGFIEAVPNTYLTYSRYTSLRSSAVLHGLHGTCQPCCACRTWTLTSWTYLQRPPLELRAYDTGFEGRWFAKYLVWYPYHRGNIVVIDKEAPPITGYMKGVGWHGYYTKTQVVYKQELLLNKQARPLFTKQEYEIHTKYGGGE